VLDFSHLRSKEVGYAPNPNVPEAFIEVPTSY
jgi:hypothetical protein